MVEKISERVYGVVYGVTEVFAHSFGRLLLAFKPCLKIY